MSHLIHGQAKFSLIADRLEKKKIGAAVSIRGLSAPVCRSRPCTPRREAIESRFRVELAQEKTPKASTNGRPPWIPSAKKGRGAWSFSSKRRARGRNDR